MCNTRAFACIFYCSLTHAPFLVFTTLCKRRNKVLYTVIAPASPFCESKITHKLYVTMTFLVAKICRED